jgi:hypothetical protein
VGTGGGGGGGGGAFGGAAQLAIRTASRMAGTLWRMKGLVGIERLPLLRVVKTGARPRARKP